MVKPSSAEPKSLGTNHTLLASPFAISGRVCRYWYANISGVGRPALIAAKVFSIAFASPWALRYDAARSPWARSIRDCRSASAARIAACLAPSAERICACFCPPPA